MVCSAARSAPCLSQQRALHRALLSNTLCAVLVSATRSAPCSSQQRALHRARLNNPICLACPSSLASSRELSRAQAAAPRSRSCSARGASVPLLLPGSHGAWPRGSFSACTGRVEPLLPACLCKSACTGRVEPLPPACLYKSACVTLSTLSKACYHTCRLGAAVELVDWGGGRASLGGSDFASAPLDVCPHIQGQVVSASASCLLVQVCFLPPCYGGKSDTRTGNPRGTARRYMSHRAVPRKGLGLVRPWLESRLLWSRLPSSRLLWSRLPSWGQLSPLHRFY